MRTPDTPKENGLAVASLVFGILSLIGAGILTGIPAIITGIMAQKNPVNKGLGMAGIVMGAISSVLSILLLIVVILFIMLGASMGSHMYEYAEPTDNYEGSMQQSI